MIQFAPADAPRTDAPPPTYSLEDIQARRKLAEEMLRQGMDASPVQHWTQGLARVAAALSGRMSLDQAAGQSAGLQKDANDTLLNLYKPSVTGAPMPAPPPAALSKTMADAPLNEDQQGVANFASGMGTQGLAQAMPGKVASALDPSLVGAVKNFEGYAPKASWDYKQNSNGYGTRAAAPGETIDRNTAEQRLNSELGKAQGLVGAFAPNAPEGFKKALTSLTYNAGPKWMDSGLGQAVQQGDWQKASDLFQQYNKAGGQTNPGLVNRRQQEAQMWLNPAAPQTPQQPMPQRPTQVADGSQGQGMTRDTLSRMLANPLTRDAAQKFILEHADPKKADAQFGVVRQGTQGPIYGWHNDKEQTIREYDKATAEQDLTKTGDEFLATLPKPQADQVRAISEGRMPLPSSFAMGKKYWQDIMSNVTQYNPQFDGVNFSARQAARKDFTSGKMAGNISSFNLAISHIDSLSKAIDGLDNSEYTAVNKANNAVAGQIGGTRQDALSTFDTARNAVKHELERAFKGTGGSLTEVESWDKLIDSAKSPSGLKHATREAIELLAGRIDALGEQYGRGMGTTIDPIKLLTPKAQEAWSRLNISGKEAPHPAATHVWNPATDQVEAVGGR